MHFQVRVPKISGDVVALCSVVDAMAMAKATAFGAAEFHQPAYDGTFADISASLLTEARKGCLQVSDQNGFAASADEIIERAKRVGTFCVHSRYVVKPDWDALKKEHPKAELPNGAWDFTGIDLGETVVDEVSSELHCLYATLKHLNDWGASASNSFSLDPNAPPWIDERGVMGLPEKRPDGSDANPGPKFDVGDTPAKVTQGEAAAIAVQAEPLESDRPSIITTHRAVSQKNPNILDAVIEIATMKAPKPDDGQSCWASFVNLAETSPRPPPLLGTDEAGVKYSDPDGENGVSYLNKKNFLKRFRRRAANHQ